MDSDPVNEVETAPMADDLVNANEATPHPSHDEHVQAWLARTDERHCPDCSTLHTAPIAACSCGFGA